MPRVCTVCTHPKRAQIDEALASQSASKRAIALRHGLVPMSLYRHERDHLEPALIEAHERALEVVHMTARGNIIEAVSDLRGKLKAYDGVRDDQWLEFMDRMIRANEQFAKINKELGNDQVNALFVSLGVSGEDEARQRLELTRPVESLSPDDGIDEAEAVLSLLLPQRPNRIRTLIAKLEALSYAEVTEDFDGRTEHHQEHRAPGGNGRQNGHSGGR